MGIQLPPPANISVSSFRPTIRMSRSHPRSPVPKSVIWCLLLVSLFLGGCSKSKPPIGDRVDKSVRGDWTGDRTYSNDFFGLTISVPSQWQLMKGDEQNMDFMLKSIGMASGNNRAAQNALRQQFSKIHVPLRALAPSDAEHSKIPNVLVMIENIEDDPSIKTGADFLKKMEKIIGASPQLPQFDGPPTETTVNQIKLWTRSSTLKVNGGGSGMFSGAGGYTVYQRGYSTVKDHYALTILCTWFSSGDNPTAEIVSKHVAAIEKTAEQIGAGHPATATESKPDVSR
jgi:hypothetical protein